jgi:hypothetical protein
MGKEHLGKDTWICGGTRDMENERDLVRNCMK